MSDPPAPPATYRVRLETNVPDSEDVVVEVRTADAPIGAARFYELVHDGFFVDAAFFRVVPDFVVQFGINADPAITACWKDETIPDEARNKHQLSNKEGTLVFATSGPNSRTTQLFVNMADNAKKLDGKDFVPIGKVVAGLDTLRAVHNPTPDDKGGIDQGELEDGGNEWLYGEYPGVHLIEFAHLES